MREVLDVVPGMPDLHADQMPGLQECRVIHENRRTILQGKSEVICQVEGMEIKAEGNRTNRNLENKENTMADYRDVVIVTYTPVQDDAGLSGKVIGRIFGNYVPFECTVDYATLHDKMVTIVNPRTWKDTGKVGWVEWSHCVEQGDDASEEIVMITRQKDGSYTLKRTK